MRRVRAADDFETIRIRLEELRQERALYAGRPVRGAACRTPRLRLTSQRLQKGDYPWRCVDSSERSFGMRVDAARMVGIVR
jgi:hypothetical protein